MQREPLIVAVYASHGGADKGVKTLAEGGLDMRRISIVGRNYHSEEQPLGFFNSGDRVRFFGKLGAFWGTIGGILFGSFVLFVPILGHLVILGPLAATLVSGTEGAILGGGTGALIGALSSIGVPRDSAIRYEAALKADKFLLVVHGDQQMLDKARNLLRETGAEALDEHRPEPAAA
ncbi:DUF1269 domain-containing protein [Sphingomonas sp. BN140010]|uniref:DUF1269 domain-containing protein n=1 Tax=Sphingomonas arvum TaxID=2992113 RepID=A0ABT3JDR7_9SPHN|nr:DUF1269 domain-containing protein [Sphingomonas sp. BN140010]MCW3797210.1 DUF1269 domain-containing protein [Sphingomonas sp. BN140010]